jgi:Ohr subfamily peroxiredoxin
MAALYTTHATATGGRAGSVRSDDALLQLQLAPPPQLGGKGGATNPEQLFAAGYAACFGSAIGHVAKAQKIALRDHAIEVTAEVGIGPRAAGGFELSVALTTTLAGVDQATAEKLVHTAHQVCPYSNATRNNIDVQLTTRVK